MGKKKIETVQEYDSIFPAFVYSEGVVLPVIPQPLKLQGDEEIENLQKAFEANQPICVIWKELISQSEQDTKLNKIGTLCRVDKVIQMPGAPCMAFVMPLGKIYISQYLQGNIPMIKGWEMPQIKALSRIRKEDAAYLARLEELFNSVIDFLNEPEKSNALQMVKEFSLNPVDKIYAMAHIGVLTNEEKYSLLEALNFKDLLFNAVLAFDQCSQRISFQASVQEKTHRELSRQQKEMFLRTHLRSIREELGESDEQDIEDLLKRAQTKKWDKDTQIQFDKELAKLQRLNFSNPEYSVIYAYLDTFLQLPWQNYEKKAVSLKKVRETLDRDHFGLEKVKERILEHMAVVKLRDDLKAPIICLYGPPGVGKTSIGKSVAEALGREYVRIALGGLHDETEIRGHRRTYIGAMPGRFIHSLEKCKTGNPLMLLDEIDKVGKDYRGDPSSALLEALDPEQNNTFHDNFIDHPYDLSKVLFIATANDVSIIPAPLRDRMEFIEVPGYIPAEKREIALRHLVDKALKENGLKEKEIAFTPEAIDRIIRFYTRESGVRSLEKKINKVLRKIALKKATRQKYPDVITPDMIEEFLGKEEVFPDSYDNNDFAGVATGLAWTPAGGDILFIETSLSPGKGEKLTLTGSLGDVMKESAVIALQYLKAHTEELGLDAENMSKVDVHIHVPEGAVPKDGPSAGITLTTSLVSAFTGKRMRPRVAMTGEMTLRGKVLPVGGIKEKIIAARQAGIDTIILSEKNRKDIEEIPLDYTEGVKFVYVKTIDEVLKEALLEEKAPFRYTFSEK